MILVQTFMGIIIIAIVYTVGKELWEDIKFNAKKISFAHDKIDDVKEWGEIDKYLKNGQTFTSIKLYNYRHNCGLLAAKNIINKRYIEINNVIPPALTISFNCRKCSDWDNVEHIRVRDVTLEEHGISKPYKGVYQCTQCGNEVILDNEEEV